MKHVIDKNKLPEKQLFPGIRAKIYHSENITTTWVTIDPGAPLPEHQHPHEQWTHVISGQLDLAIDGQSSSLEAGMSVFIPSNIRHSGKAITKCEVIDVFNPPRNDLK